MSILKKIIFILFAALLFLVPIILYPFTSEVFEFNKIVLVYVLTVLITGAWITEMILEKKIIFRRTILDIPFLIFLLSQVISTIFSIDKITSIFGYYSRFNGGLLSVISYLLLYWAFVSNIDSKKLVKLIYITLASAGLVAFYGILEHFGIDKNVWVQDVQNRVFSTLGQPNWLAASLVALMPITWALSQSQINLNFKIQNLKFLIYPSLSALFFITLLFTKSRSGFLGFIAADIIFWTLSFIKFKKEVMFPFIIHNSLFLILSLIIGTQFTPSLISLINRSGSQTVQAETGSTALETGGTESGTIRKIVWEGAIQVWLHYPVFGTGVETFAYSFYLYRPKDQNLTSEWDFIYNKAHNEYLNIAANSGTVGLIAYLALIGASIFIFTKELKILNIGLLAGYISLLITNFFGFSVVPTELQFFLFPAFAIALGVETKTKEAKEEKITGIQKTGIGTVAFLALIFLFLVSRYWYADFAYATGKNYNAAGQADTATKYLSEAISLAPYQPLYYAELANSYSSLALSFYQQKMTDQAVQFTEMAVDGSNKAISISPANVNLKRSQVGLFIMLSVINPNYLTNAKDTLLSAIAQAPTDAKLYYNLGLTYVRLGQIELSLETLKKTIDLKANYKEARLAYAILLIGKKQVPEARTQLEYILTNIDPNDSLTLQTLAGIK